VSRSPTAATSAAATACLRRASTGSPPSRPLTDDEVVRLITIGVERLGVREVRFTGGEPLLRRGLVDIVGRTHALGVETSLTTNALGLSRTAQALADAGLDRINASIDSVRPETFATSPGATVSPTWSPASRRPRPPGSAR